MTAWVKKMEKTIRIKYHSDKIEKLTYIAGKSDWIDLRSAQDYRLKKGDFALIDEQRAVFILFSDNGENVCVLNEKHVVPTFPLLYF